jgi:ABC-type hemin transport system substrate-binding protein
LCEPLECNATECRADEEKRRETRSIELVPRIPTKNERAPARHGKLHGMKICSLLPSATEILFALGLGDQVAGVSHECDFPPDARTKPVLIV